jgi:hypothetical protein
MESDEFYTIGASHNVCQDYARAGRANGRVSHFALVSDGCSSSADSDLGARFLVHAAEHRLRLFGSDYDHGWIAHRAAAAVSLFGASPQCLDATLLSAFVVDDTQVRISIAGDGFIAARRRDGTLVTWEICDGGAPAYLSYQLSRKRFESFLEAGYGHRVITQRVAGLVSGRQAIRLSAKDFVSEIWLQVADYESVLLMSDGATSFEGPGVSTHEIALELSAIKSSRGEFVKRRSKRFLSKYCKARGWVHQDDLAVAGLFLPEASS